MSRRRLERPESISIYHEIKSIFDLIDVDKDNLIMRAELEKFLKQFDLEADEKLQQFLDTHETLLSYYGHQFERRNLKISKLKQGVERKKKPPPLPPRPQKKKRETIRMMEAIVSPRYKEQLTQAVELPVQEDSDSSSSDESDEEEEVVKKNLQPQELPQKKVGPPLPSRVLKPKTIIQDVKPTLEQNKCPAVTAPSSEENTKVIQDVTTEEPSKKKIPVIPPKDTKPKLSILKETNPILEKKVAPAVPPKDSKPQISHEKSVVAPFILSTKEIPQQNDKQNVSPKKVKPPPIPSKELKPTVSQQQVEKPIQKLPPKKLTPPPIPSKDFLMKRENEKLSPRQQKPPVPSIALKPKKEEKLFENLSPKKMTPPSLPSQDLKPQLSHQSEELSSKKMKAPYKELKATQMKNPENEDDHPKRSPKLDRPPSTQKRRAMSFLPNEEANQLMKPPVPQQKVRSHTAIVLSPPTAPQEKKLQTVDSFDLKIPVKKGGKKPKEFKKLSKPWSKKKSGGIHFLAEFGQLIQKEAERRQEEALEEHVNSLSIFGIGEANDHLFDFNEEEKKEKKKKKKKGYLTMKQHFTGKWKKVYCVLRKDKLIYYKSKKSYNEGESQISSVFLISASIDFQEVKNHEFCFNLISRGDDNLFECESEDERKDWVFNIRDVIAGRWDYNPPTEGRTENSKHIGKIKNPTYIQDAKIEYIRHF
eukprot:gene12778-7052_t